MDLSENEGGSKDEVVKHTCWRSIIYIILQILSSTSMKTRPWRSCGWSPVLDQHPDFTDIMLSDNGAKWYINSA